MASTLNPYVNIPDGRGREALEFYQSVLGGEPEVYTFGQMGMDGPFAEQVMHSQLQTPDGLTLMVADAPPEMRAVTVGNNVMICLSGDDSDIMSGWFHALSEGGQVSIPLEKQSWGDVYGEFSDRFGIHWMVNIAGSGPDDNG